MAYSETTFGEICERIGKGDTLTRICCDEGMPDISTVYNWMDGDATGERQARYDAARQRQAEAWSDEIIDIADDDSRDTITRGDKLRVDTEWVNRARLRVDTRKWVMARVHGRRWGDRVSQEVTGPAGGPFVVSWQQPAEPAPPTSPAP